ncbi:MAG: SemiSWEET transporter [Candidatus Omnitrophica bacterium]|nr:SemiSWEET transporter [Candidatus Omnitrophota bacterium]
MAHLILGLIAGTLTTVAFVPQVIKIYKTKDAKDLSLATFCIFFCGVFFWLIYGIVIMEWPVILANGITLILSSIIIAMKLKYR